MGTKDGLKILIDDHNRIKNLFERYKTASNKSEICKELIREICQHSSVEEQLVYPLYSKYCEEKGSIVADKAVTDHQLAKDLMVFLEKHERNKYPEIFDNCIDQLNMVLMNHIEDEENKYFPVLREKAPKEEIMDLEDKIINAKKTAPIHPHPSAPAFGIGAKLTHPLTGAMEKGMEKITGQ